MEKEKKFEGKIIMAFPSLRQVEKRDPKKWTEKIITF